METTAAIRDSLVRRSLLAVSPLDAGAVARAAASTEEGSAPPWR